MENCFFSISSISFKIYITEKTVSLFLTGHPKIKLFITQGGLQSTDEALSAGVPLIGIPMLADQFYNSEKYAQHKIGLKVMMKDIEVESFRNNIKTVIEDKR